MKSTSLIMKSSCLNLKSMDLSKFINPRKISKSIKILEPVTKLIRLAVYYSFTSIGLFTK